MANDSATFYDMVENKQMYRFEKKYATVGDDFVVNAANKAFLSYFERVGVRIFSMKEFIHKEDTQMFKAFIGDDANVGRSFFYRTCMPNGEHKPTVIKLRGIKHHENNAFFSDIEFIDIDETLYINDNAIAEVTKMRALLGLTSEYFFTYDRSDNKIKIFVYDDLKRSMLYNMDVDSWCEEMIQKNYVSGSEIGKLHILVNDMKEYTQVFASRINCAILTQNDEKQKLKFNGMVFGNGGKDAVVIGRITTQSGTNSAALADVKNELQYDALTGVYNKKTITEFAKKVIAEKKNSVTAIVIMDVDHFKSVNDRYGHMYGDKVLSRVGQKLREVVGEDGVVGRIGGDEFMMVLFDIQNEHMLRSIMRAIKSQVKWEFIDEITDFTVSCSIGAATYPNNGTDYEELFKKADYCLYIAKEKGRDRYVFFRDDLHREFYEASLAKVDCGARNTSRDVKELMHLSKFFSDVQKDQNKAIKELLTHMQETYNIDNINIYYGKDMEKVYTVGMELNEADDAKYVFTDEYKNLLNGSQCMRIDYIGKYMEKAPEFCEVMKQRRVFSSLQCVIGTPDNIKGMVSFNRCKESAQWADYEINAGSIFASYLSIVHIPW